MNWTPSNIFEARDRKVMDTSGAEHLVKLYPDGWAIGTHEGLNVWAACNVLNNLQATLTA